MEKRDWLLRGTTIGTGIGLIAIFITLLPIESLGSWTTGDSLIFGLLSSGTGLLWDINLRQQRRSAAQDRTSVLMKALEDSDLHTDTVVSLCQHAGDVKNMEIPEHILEHIRLKIEEFSNRLGRLHAESELRTDSEEDLMDLVLVCTAGAQEYIWATSATDGVDVGFWESQTGVDYLAAQHKARSEREVRIRRLFFTKGPRFPDALLRAMVRQESEQIEVGARVRASGMEDFIVFDGTIAVLTKPSSDGSGVEGGTLDFKPERIEKRTEAFELWWDAAVREWAGIKSKANF